MPTRPTTRRSTRSLQASSHRGGSAQVQSILRESQSQSTEATPRDQGARDAAMLDEQLQANQRRVEKLEELMRMRQRAVDLEREL